MTTEPQSPLKVGVIGMGRFGRLHSLTLQGLAEAELVGIVARRQESLDAVTADLPGIPGWLNLQQAIEESGADAWVVACTTASHVVVSRALLEAGKTVLLEKPVANSLADALSLGFGRVQFTPDLMPADITGTEVLEEDRTTGKRANRAILPVSP